MVANVGAGAEDNMEVVGHNGVPADLHREDTGELGKTVMNPVSAVLIALAAVVVGSHEKTSANAPRNRMVNPFH